ncbi:uncharacterized protein SPPG_05008 [Spizellomyces punctatus DAOM BR117]|uniref:DRBM domain-containing protein n=1 Tax=Spizellomyces punctatus (strain DAOM BR117) TaxID=645134 RepID=A0A0L0HEW6_SPIPD|nr:uncharacterized protein SPPG_05008 [Spizellomyces punctatus DAOM BR117]KNC99622.1 hypothetical protein SPPG_05008 [Spizellomyces punctatus DAOM BR117]|eukprot:XP_016607662.1 hypothetical protein SPPG_05008 [Spizellomyces punctatus DAOM BR117]
MDKGSLLPTSSILSPPYTSFFGIFPSPHPIHSVYFIGANAGRQALTGLRSYLVPKDVILAVYVEGTWQNPFVNSPPDRVFVMSVEGQDLDKVIATHMLLLDAHAPLQTTFIVLAPSTYHLPTCPSRRILLPAPTSPMPNPFVSLPAYFIKTLSQSAQVLLNHNFERIARELLLSDISEFHVQEPQWGTITNTENVVNLMVLANVLEKNAPDGVYTVRRDALKALDVGGRLSRLKSETGETQLRTNSESPFNPATGRTTFSAQEEDATMPEPSRPEQLDADMMAMSDISESPPPFQNDTGDPRKPPSPTQSSQKSNTQSKDQLIFSHQQTDHTKPNETTSPMNDAGDDLADLISSDIEDDLAALKQAVETFMGKSDPMVEVQATDISSEEDQSSDDEENDASSEEKATSSDDEESETSTEEDEASGDEDEKSEMEDDQNDSTTAPVNFQLDLITGPMAVDTPTGPPISSSSFDPTTSRSDSQSSTFIDRLATFVAKQYPNSQSPTYKLLTFSDPTTSKHLYRCHLTVAQEQFESAYLFTSPLDAAQDVARLACLFMHCYREAATKTERFSGRLEEIFTAEDNENPDEDREEGEVTEKPDDEMDPSEVMGLLDDFTATQAGHRIWLPRFMSYVTRQRLHVEWTYHVGPGGRGSHKATIQIGGKTYTSASSHTKRGNAKEDAAHVACKALGIDSSPTPSTSKSSTILLHEYCLRTKSRFQAHFSTVPPPSTAHAAPWFVCTVTMEAGEGQKWTSAAFPKKADAKADACRMAMEELERKGPKDEENSRSSTDGMDAPSQQAPSTYNQPLPQSQSFIASPFPSYPLSFPPSLAQPQVDLSVLLSSVLGMLQNPYAQVQTNVDASVGHLSSPGRGGGHRGRGRKRRRGG